MIAVVKTSAEEPLHLRVTSEGNNKTLVVGENLSNIEDVYTEIEAVAREFGVHNPQIQPNMNGDALLYDGNGAFCAEITFVHETGNADD